MVALALGSFLLLGVVNVFITSKESAKVENALARVQENGRFALDLISEDILSTQYTGCNSVAGNFINMAKNVDYEGIRAYELIGTGNWNPTLPGAPNKLATLSGVTRVGSDLLHLQIAKPMLGTEVMANITPASTSVPINNNANCAAEKDSLVLIASCVTANMFRVTNTITCSRASPVNAASLEFGGSGNDITSIDPGYDREAEIMVFEDIEWYVADTGRNKNGIDVYALYRRVNGTAAEEMIEGVEHMQLQFGQRVGAATRYVGARDSSLDWDEVTSVRVALLIQSFESIRDSDDSATYRLLDESVDSGTTTARHSGGRVIRRVFSTTTILRNTAYDVRT
jgi:type IV pilus assembly protein PilW